MANASTGGDGRLAAYGSLRPGEQHHRLVSDLAVVAAGTVRGTLHSWEGYPVLTIDPDGEAVGVVVFGGLTEARWRVLDDFEGPMYRRELVSVQLADGNALVATCYLRAEA